MSRQRNTEEFKIEAVKQVTERAAIPLRRWPLGWEGGGYSLYHWVKRYTKSVEQGGLNTKCNMCPFRYDVAMTQCYRHLSAEDRAAIMMMRATYSIRAIATHLGHAPSTVSRGIARHTVSPMKGYDASLAGYRARLTRHRPRRRPKLHPDGELFEVVVSLLRKYWSPQQIARTMKLMSLNDSRRQVSHEAIYNALYVMPAAASRMSSSPAYVRATASVGHVVVAGIDDSRSPAWSASTYGRLRSKIA